MEHEVTRVKKEKNQEKESGGTFFELRGGKGKINKLVAS